jgi:NADH:ubiquinone oxidoreductase subunit 6 (subunit J)
MKKDKAIIILIAIWQLSWVFVALMFLDMMNWGFIFGIRPYILYYLKSQALIIWWVFNLFLIVFLPFSILGCIGLFKRKNWGRVLSIIALGITLVLLCIYISTGLSMPDVVMLKYPDFPNEVYTVETDIFDEYALPIFIISLIVAACILPVVYLTRLRIKELFKSRPV